MSVCGALLVVKAPSREYGPQLWCWPGFLFIVLVIVLVVVLDLSRFRQPGIDYKNEDEDD